MVDDKYGFVYDEVGTPYENTLAKSISSVLQDVYPDHGWLVTVQGDMATIANTSVCSDPWNSLKGAGQMLIKQRDIQDPKRLFTKIVRFGGEYLERAGLKRGAWHGDTAHRMQKD